MSYSYVKQRSELFTEDGTALVLKLLMNTQRLLREAGAFRAQESWEGIGGDTWTLLAALDYLVELGEIREITGESVAAQHRVFVAVR